jgi:branched-chain amino acid transport system substrate-binding protein
MRLLISCAVVTVLACTTWAQTALPCSGRCDLPDPSSPSPQSGTCNGAISEHFRQLSRHVSPHNDHDQELNEYNGAACELPDASLKEFSEIRIGFIAPLVTTSDQAMGYRMLKGATLAIDEANAAGGYRGKPFKLMLHNDSAVWGAASNEIVKMIYDENVWAIFGSIGGDVTQTALRVASIAEIPLVNSASTEPTLAEAGVPWYFTNLQDDRQQGYTLAWHIYNELGLTRVAILRANDRYGRFGVINFSKASRILGHPVVLEQTFMPGENNFRQQLGIIKGANVDAIVLWSDVVPAAQILQGMQELKMKQRVFGSHRTIADKLTELAGPAAEGFEAVFPYDPSRTDALWDAFKSHYEARFEEKPDQLAALAYDAMRILIAAIRRAGLNKGRIRDALSTTQIYQGVTGDRGFGPNCNNGAPLFLAHVHNGAIQYRRTMEIPAPVPESR